MNRRLFITLAGLLLASMAGLRAADPQQSKAAPAPAFAPVADVAGLPCVLLIGDSISMGYTPPTRALLKDKANVHRPPNNCSSTGYGLTMLNAWLGTNTWDVIHFNFGLHDAKLPPEGVRHSPPEVYEKNLRELVKRLKATGAKLIWATTTPVPNSGILAPNRRFGSVDQYNTIAKKVMDENDVAIDDLNAAIAPHVGKLQNPGDVHFNGAGSELLAQQVAASILAALKAGAP
ncbi:MAG: SGNH/GDSL hydrolase family protein [Verrucomicrobiota bacterium]